METFTFILAAAAFLLALLTWVRVGLHVDEHDEPERNVSDVIDAALLRPGNATGPHLHFEARRSGGRAKP